MGAEGGVKPKKSPKKSAKRVDNSSAEKETPSRADEQQTAPAGDQPDEAATNTEVQAPAKTLESSAPETPRHVLETTPANGNLVVITNMVRDAAQSTGVLVRLTCLLVVVASVVAAAVWLIAQADVRLGFFALAMMGGGGTTAAVVSAIVKARSGRRDQSGGTTGSS